MGLVRFPVATASSSLFENLQLKSHFCFEDKVLYYYNFFTPIICDKRSAKQSTNNKNEKTATIYSDFSFYFNNILTFSSIYTDFHR